MCPSPLPRLARIAHINNSVQIEEPWAGGSSPLVRVCLFGAGPTCPHAPWPSTTHGRVSIIGGGIVDSIVFQASRRRLLLLIQIRSSVTRSTQTPAAPISPHPRSPFKRVSFDSDAWLGRTHSNPHAHTHPNTHNTGVAMETHRAMPTTGTAAPASPCSSCSPVPAAAAAATTGPYHHPNPTTTDAAAAASREMVLGNEPLLRHVLTQFLGLQDQLLHVRGVARCARSVVVFE